MSSRWDDIDQFTYDLLQCGTSLIPNREVAGIVFALGLVITDHLYRPWRAVSSWTVWR